MAESIISVTYSDREVIFITGDKTPAEFEDGKAIVFFSRYKLPVLFFVY